MGFGDRNYFALILVGIGTAIIIGALVVYGFDLSTIPFWFSLGPALILCGIIFVFVQFHADRRYCASCMLSFALFAFITSLVFTLLYSPMDFLTFGMGWMYAFVFLICGVLFWFFEPRGSGGGWVGLDCSGCESCGPALLFLSILSLCVFAYLLETGILDPMGSVLYAVTLFTGALLHLARLARH